MHASKSTILVSNIDHPVLRIFISPQVDPIQASIVPPVTILDWHVSEHVYIDAFQPAGNHAQLPSFSATVSAATRFLKFCVLLLLKHGFFTARPR